MYSIFALLFADDVAKNSGIAAFSKKKNACSVYKHVLGVKKWGRTARHNNNNNNKLLKLSPRGLVTIRAATPKDRLPQEWAWEILSSCSSSGNEISCDLVKECEELRDTTTCSPTVCIRNTYKRWSYIWRSIHRWCDRVTAVLKNLMTTIPSTHAMASSCWRHCTMPNTSHRGRFF